MASANNLYIFPPLIGTPAQNSPPLVQHPQPTNVEATIFSPRTGPTPIYVHFRGPRAPYRFLRNAPPDLSLPTSRIELSLWAHLGRSGAPVPIPLPYDPSACVADATQIDLCHVDFAVDMNQHITRTDFGLMLQRLAPPAPAVGAPQHSVVEWDIVCRRCGAAVRHYYTDEIWNGRYLAHFGEPRCKKWKGSDVYKQ